MHPQLKKGISVVIPALNESHTIAQTLESAVVCPEINEIIVVDNGSIDGTALVAQKYGARIIEVLPRNRSRARNAGLINASSEITLFLDAGVTFDPSAICAIIKRFELEPEIAAIQGRIVPRAFQNNNELINNPMFTDEIDCNSHLGERYTDTKALAVQTQIAKKISGFDECLKRAEDIDFGWRLNLLNYKFVLQNNAKFYAQGSSSIRASLQRGAQTAFALVALHAKWNPQNRRTFLDVFCSFIIIGKRQITHTEILPFKERVCSLLDGMVTFLLYFLIRPIRAFNRLFA
jgi:glycosyltransferase involved in cell wall biosynthesis